ncbi:MAG: hypothetical protein A2020_08850 [Lentisphaerae bacterium GWF2_45_14]|nr:MAG: hypothetical protein A2020_08850 [Lentisphaerae bacterium GWF2_45_14]
MTDKDNNLSAGPEAGGGHEFLPLDFSMNEKRSGDKRVAAEKMPLPESDEHLQSGPASTQSAVKLPLYDAVRNTAAPQEEMPSVPENAKSLNEVFPEDKDDSTIFPTTHSSLNSDTEIAELKKKFEDEPPSAPRTAPKSPAMLRRGFPPVPPKPKAPSVKLVQPKTPVLLTGSISPENASPGQILQEVRVRSGLSLAQVEQITKIKADYVSSLERDDYKSLPPPVYANAYVKNLCSLYNISPEDTELILKNIKRDSSQVVSEEIIQHIEEEMQVNPEEERKVKRLIFAFIAIVIIFVSSLVLLGVKLYNSYKRGGLAASSVEQATVFDEKELEKLIVPQTFSIDELPAPKERGR